MEEDEDDGTHSNNGDNSSDAGDERSIRCVMGMFF